LLCAACSISLVIVGRGVTDLVEATVAAGSVKHSQHRSRSSLRNQIQQNQCWSKRAAPKPLELACFQRRTFRFALVSQHTF
jgi:hypothetical protein